MHQHVLAECRLGDDGPFERTAASRVPKEVMSTVAMTVTTAALRMV
ncbi:MAG: hypothetical protein R2695_19785 [Acidimicrobiales bacterium]